MNKNLLFLLMGLAVSLSAFAQPALIPAPNSIRPSEGEFVFDGEVKVLYGEHALTQAEYFRDWLKTQHGIDVSLSPMSAGPSGGKMMLLNCSPEADLEKLRSEIPKTPNMRIDPLMIRSSNEDYTLGITPSAIVVNGSGPAGLFYALQTLSQYIELSGTAQGAAVKIGCMQIQDKPAFAHRGMLLDCGRHFMPKELIMKYIDLLASYKMNTLHWHLTEDQGWRIQVDAYPKLTEVGAWRTEPDGKRYGGFYSKDDIREIVAYAESRYIQVVPEIEMPGHSSAAIAAYPWLGCTGERISVQNEWGVFKDIYCAGNDSTFQFIEKVLDEVCALFPSTFIHIGGDEAPHVRWDECSKCKRRMKAHALRTPLELQAYFLRRVAGMLAERGKVMIGWDEIVESELPENACVQSWRGTEGGQTAVSLGHRVIMSPTSHCYFDYPLSSIDLGRVYSFDPLQGIADEAAHLVMGGECNLWTEHILPETLDEKVFPRMLAMAEVLWTYPASRDYTAFYTRVSAHYPWLQARGVRYGYPCVPATITGRVVPGAVEVTTTPAVEGIAIQWQARDLPLQGWSSTDRESVFGPSQPVSEIHRVTGASEVRIVPEAGSAFSGNATPHAFFCAHRGAGMPVSLSYTVNSNYPGGGPGGMTDGRLGGTSFRDEGWQAVQGENMEVTVDLGSVQPVSYLNTRWYHYTNAWIFRPEKVSYAVSTDGTTWKEVAERPGPCAADSKGESIVEVSARLESVQARFVKMSALSLGRNPDWHDAAGSESWLFCDELIVR